jgi:predicted small lipoprotein YifL
MKRKNVSNKAKEKSAMNKKLYFFTAVILFFSLMITACGHKGDPQPPEGEDAVKAPKSKRYGS